MKEQTVPPATGVREPTASSAYFESEAHYRRVASAIRARCEGARGHLLVTGDPAPNGTQLARALGGDGAQRNDVCVIPCHPDLSFAGLVTAYAARLGIAIAAAQARQQWIRIAGLMRPPRGPAYILLLEHAERLAESVLDELSLAPEGRAAPVVLIGPEALARRLHAPSASGRKPETAAHLRFRQLADDEIGACIRFQLGSAGSPGKDVLAARVVELIAAQAKGDPGAVDRLMRAILDANLGLGPGVLAGLRLRALKQNEMGAEIDLGLEQGATPTMRVVTRSDPAPLRRLAAVANDGGSPVAPAGSPPPAPPPERARTPAAEPIAHPTGARRSGAATAVALLIGLAALAAGVALYPSVPDKIWERVTALGASRLEPTAAPAETAGPAPGPVEGHAVPAAAAVIDPTAPPAAVDPSAVALAPSGKPRAAEPAMTVAAVPPAAPPEAEATREPEARATEPAATMAAAMPPASPEPEATREPAPNVAGNAAPAVDVALLVWRGDRLLAAGEIVAARRFFERAAAAGDADGACGLAKTYDPLLLRQLGVRGVAPDPAAAADWYRKAAAAGSAEAPGLLDRLRAAFPS